MLDDAKECLFTEILPVIDKKISLVENGKRAAAVTVRNAYRAQITTSITEHYVGVAQKKEELMSFLNNAANNAPDQNAMAAGQVDAARQGHGGYGRLQILHSHAAYSECSSSHSDHPTFKNARQHGTYKVLNAETLKMQVHDIASKCIIPKTKDRIALAETEKAFFD